MRIFIFSICLLLLSTHSYSQSEKESSVFFIRHAEKEKDGSKDPLLTKTGEKRAIYWAEVFKNIEFDLIYSTQTARTLATAIPTAKDQGLEVLFYDAKSIDIIELVKKNPGKKILIVGHSNSTPRLVNNLIGENKYQEIEHSNNSNLYIVNYSLNQVSMNLLFIELP